MTSAEIDSANFIAHTYYACPMELAVPRACLTYSALLSKAKAIPGRIGMS